MLIVYFRRHELVGTSLLLLLLVYSLLFSNEAQSNTFDGTVTRAIFTTKFKNNKPVNEVLILENNNKNLYFFSVVKNMQGKVISHRWEHHGKKVFEQKFKVSAKSEKLISKYKLDPAKTGEWMVIITDGQGWPIKATMFKYVKKGSFAGKGIVPIKY